jgi:cell division protein FtsB
MKSLWGQGNRYLRISRTSIDISARLARLFLIGMTVLIAAIFIAGDVGLWNLWQAQRDLDGIERDIIKLEEETSYLRREIDELTNDPLAIEKVAREQYGYLMPGDRIYRIITLETTDKNGKVLPSSLDTRNATP